MAYVQLSERHMSKLSRTRRIHTQVGMTIIEVVITIAIFSLVTVSLYMLITLGTQFARDNQARLDAIAISQSQIESIKNVPYDTIGTVGGVPQGNFEQNETLIRNNVTFTRTTDIRYIDDEFDGLAPTDTINTDYKKIRVSTSWEGQVVGTPVTLITTIAPPGIETSEGGGTLWIEAYNASGEPVVNATVAITNTQVSPSLSITSATDSLGRYILPGAEASAGSYHVVVSKNGYATSQTYDVDPVNNPNPDPGNLPVIEAEVTTKVFLIDVVSSLQFHFEDVSTGTPISNLPFHIYGTKRIGTDLEGADILKYDEEHTTNATGDSIVTNLEYDTYAVEINDSATGYDFAGSAPHLPYVLAPNSTELITIHTAQDASQSLLITVEDGTETPIVGATARLYNESLTTDLTQTTNAAGQTFFTPLTNETFTIEITMEGYDFYQAQVEVVEDEQQIIPLTSST